MLKIFIAQISKCIAPKSYVDVDVIHSKSKLARKNLHKNLRSSFFLDKSETIQKKEQRWNFMVSPVNLNVLCSKINCYRLPILYRTDTYLLYGNIRNKNLCKWSSLMECQTATTISNLTNFQFFWHLKFRSIIFILSPCYISNVKTSTSFKSQTTFSTPINYYLLETPEPRQQSESTIV